MNTPRRTIRIEDDIWLPAKAKADEEGTTVTDVIRKALAVYVKAGAAVLLAVLAFVTLSACGAEDGPGSPVAERTAVVSAPVAETPSEAVTTAPACVVADAEWLAEINAMLPSPELVATLEALDPADGCTPADAKRISAVRRLLDNPSIGGVVSATPTS